MFDVGALIAICKDALGLGAKALEKSQYGPQSEKLITEKIQPIAWIAARVIAGLLGILFAWYGVWYGANLCRGVGISRNSILLPIPLCALSVSALLLLFLTLGGKPKSRQYLRSALLGGIMVGGPAFLVGFIGPIVVAFVLGQDAPQGPL